MQYNVLLISTYELGHQPFGLASPAAWFKRDGFAVDCMDLAIEKLDEDVIRRANFIAFYLPMHTATRLASVVIPMVRNMNPGAHLCAYGLYATENADFLAKLGIGTFIGGEFEGHLLNIAKQLRNASPETSVPQRKEVHVSFERQKFVLPDRSKLPPLQQYAQLNLPDGKKRLAGYTEASRGCKHRCRHCPIVPVYDGKFRVIQRDIVLGDIRQQVSLGADHITFGDPDFFNGVGHAIPLVQELHRNYPDLTYDVTVKIEHLLKYPMALPILRDTGCLFVTSAVESVDDRVLEILNKGHMRADFIKVVELFSTIGLHLAPTFVAFTPWLTLDGYRDLLSLLHSLGQVDNTASIQLAIRLLIPSGSLLLERAEVKAIIGDYDEKALSYSWMHPDPRVDKLQREVDLLVRRETAAGSARTSIFDKIWATLHEAMQCTVRPLPPAPPLFTRASVPYLTEPWFC